MIQCACGCGNLRDRYDRQGREHRYIPGHQKRIRETRHCYACGTTTSTQQHGKSQHWTPNWGTPHFLCKGCTNHILDREYNIQYKARRVLFRGKRVTLDANPRKGVCEICGKEGRTSIKYSKDTQNPRDFTIELCISCHTKIGMRSGELVNIQTIRESMKRLNSHLRFGHAFPKGNIPWNKGKK